jgi:hypothetical protein
VTRERVVGMDGTKGGWVAVELIDGAVARVVRMAGIDPAASLGGFADASVIAIDIPIGMDDGRCDRAADMTGRSALGRRRATLFPVPPRRVFEASGWGRDTTGDRGPLAGYADANAASKALRGRGISRQLWAIAARIGAVDVLAHRDLRLQEVHPELSFMELRADREPGTDRALSCSKHTAAGRAHRRRLLEEVGIVLPRPDSGRVSIPIATLGDAIGTASSVPEDDILDAAVAAWTARRIVAGTSTGYPSWGVPVAGDRRIGLIRA